MPLQILKKILMQNAATSIDDHPYLQFYVKLECVVFSPKLKQKVKATVQKLGDTFVGNNLFEINIMKLKI